MREETKQRIAQLVAMTTAKDAKEEKLMEKRESLALKEARRILEPDVVGRLAEAEGMRAVLEALAENRIELAAQLLEASGKGMVGIAGVKKKLEIMAAGEDDIERYIEDMAEEMLIALGKIPNTYLQAYVAAEVAFPTKFLRRLGFGVESQREDPHIISGRTIPRSDDR